MYSDKHSKTSNYNKLWVKGINEENIIKISEFRGEDKKMLEFRLNSFKIWKNMREPRWIEQDYKIDYDNVYPYSYITEETKQRIKDTFDILDISNEESERVTKIAMDLVVDSESIITTHQAKLKDMGIIFCSIKEAVIEYPDLVYKYIGTVISPDDNFFAALNSAFFSDGTFCYIPKNVKCPIDLSSYFRLDSLFGSQFERTLIIAEEGSEVNYIEGCSAPVSKVNQLHNAIVEIYLHKNAKVNYSTLQNWYSGDEEGNGGVYNFVVKRGLCEGENSELNWLQVELGSLITWKYPSCVLKGNGSKGSFTSLNLTNNKMFADTGTKMIHIGANTSSFINSKSCSKDNSTSVFRSLVKVLPTAINTKVFSNCDTMLIGSNCSTKALPYFNIMNKHTNIQHEASMFNIDEQVLFYLQTKGLNLVKSQQLIVQNFVGDIIDQLPDEFYLEVKPILDIKIGNNI